MPKIVEIKRADDPRDVIHEAVQLLAEGKLVALPTETTYVVAAHALHPAGLEAMERLRESMGVEGPWLALRTPLEAWDFVGEFGPLARRLSRRCWPGPVVLIFKAPEPGPSEPDLFHQLPVQAQRLITRMSGVACRVSPHDVLHAVLRLTPAPLLCLGEHGPEGTACDTIEKLMALSGDAVDLAIDDGPTRYGQPSTVVRLEGSSFRLLREGVVTPRMLARLSGQVVLFVCTGNTCRSPMAESMFRKMLTQRLDCAEEDLVDRGYIIASAGLAAGPGNPPSPEAVQILQGRGVDLKGHESQPVTERLLNQADVVYTMTRQHRDLIIREFPEISDRVQVLSRDGTDISDPIGYGLEEYEKCASEIERHLQQILADLSP